MKKLLGIVVIWALVWTNTASAGNAIMAWPLPSHGVTSLTTTFPLMAHDLIVMVQHAPDYQLWKQTRCERVRWSYLLLETTFHPKI